MQGKILKIKEIKQNYKFARSENFDILVNVILAAIAKVLILEETDFSFINYGRI